MSNTGRLERALDSAAFLLREGNECAWADRLQRLKRDLADADSRARASTDLLAAFGGMSSLNDVVLRPDSSSALSKRTSADLSRELDTHLERVFREVKLLDEPFRARVLWHWLRWRHRNELPPHVRSAFRR